MTIEDELANFCPTWCVDYPVHPDGAEDVHVANVASWESTQVDVVQFTGHAPGVALVRDGTLRLDDLSPQDCRRIAADLLAAADRCDEVRAETAQ